MSMRNRRRYCNTNVVSQDVLQPLCSDVDNNIYPCNHNECECGFEEETEDIFPQNPMFGQSYVPFQMMSQVFTPEVGLRMGTIFPELVSEYVPCQSVEEIMYLRATNEIKGGCNDA